MVKHKFSAPIRIPIWQIVKLWLTGKSLRVEFEVNLTKQGEELVVHSFSAQMQIPEQS